MCPVTRFFAVETNLSFWWDLEKLSQKSVPSHTFLRCGDYLEFLMGLGKIFTKKCAQSYVSSLWRLTWVFDGTWKNVHKKVCPVTRFFAVETYLKFLRGLGKFRQKGVTSYTFFSQCKLSYVFDETWKVSKRRCDQYHGFSQCRLTWVFDGTWKNVHKKSVPSHTFLRCGD